MEWISVEDMLPEIRRHFVAAYTDQGIELHPYTVHIVYDESSRQYLTEIISHWMPIPEPPTN